VGKRYPKVASPDAGGDSNPVAKHLLI